MSMDPNAPYQSPGMQAGAPQKGGGSKVMLGVGIGCGIVLLLCCGVGVAVYMTFQSAFQIETDPGKAAAIAQSITDLEAPAGFNPQMSMSIKVPFANKKVMTMSVYTGPNNKGSLIVAEFGEEMAGNNPEQMRMQMEQSMRQQQQGQGAQKLQLEGEPREVKTTIRGQESTFTIQKGKGENGEEFYQVQGSFQGKGGPAFVLGQFPADQIDEEKTEAFVRSIK
jgi:hypothetical protein